MKKSEFKFDFDEYAWIAKTTINLFKKQTEVDILIEGEEDDDIEDAQMKSIDDFINFQDTYKNIIEKGLISYYKEELPEIRLRYSENVNDYAPIIEKISDLINILRIESIFVPYIYDKSEIMIGFLFERSWDLSHNLGVKTVNRRLAGIGDAAGLLF